MKEFLASLQKTVKPQTSPVAVKFFEETHFDGKAKVKNKKINICQQIAYSRYYRWSTYITAEDSFCVLGASCCGLIKTPERVLKGEVNCNVYQKDIHAAANMQKLMPRVDEEVKGVLTYSLERPVENLEPDVIVMYVNSAQAMRFVQAFLYNKGGEFVMKSSGDAGVCSRGVAEVYKYRKPVLEIPCLGDRRFAMAQDFELIVGFPFEMMNEVAEGLLSTHKAGIRYPIPFDMVEGCSLPDEYTTKESDL